MNTRKHKLGLRHRPVPEKIIRCGHLVASLRRLPAERQQLLLLDEFETLHQLAAADDKAVNLLRNQLASAIKRRAARTKALEEAAHRSAMAHAIRVKSEQELHAVGLDLEAPKTSIGLPAAPKRLRAMPVGGDSSGAVKLRWVRPVRHCFHIIEMTTDPSGKDGWKIVAHGNRASCIVRGLKPGALHWFRVSAQTATGQGPWIELQARAGH